jgi:hypothetical protein
MPRFCSFLLLKNVVEQPFRPKKMVDRDLFVMKVKVDYASKVYLSRLPLSKYAAILNTVERVKQLGKKIDRLMIDPPDKLSGIDFGRLPDNFLLEQIKGFTLDLRGLQAKYNAFKKRPAAQPEQSHSAVGVNIEMAAELKRISAMLATMQEEKTAATARTPKQEIVSPDEMKGLVDTGRPFGPERFLPRGLSRLVNYRVHGRQVSGEIIDEPMRTASHLLGTQFAFINEIGIDAWGVFPPDFARERLMDVSKAVFQRVDGEKAGYTSAKTVTVGGKKVRWFEIGITKQRFQKMGLQTRSFYWLFKEAYFEEVAKYIAARGRFFWLNFIFAVPSLVRAALYALGWIKKAPENIADIKVPIAYLAVHPSSLGPILEYVEDVFPNPYHPDRKPDPEKLEIARAVLPPEAKLDERTFVVEGDYGGIEHLIPDPSKKPGEGGVLDYKDPVVNRFMRERLRYEDRAGRDQMVVLNLKLADFRRYFERMRKMKIEARTIDRVLNATKDL